MYILKNHPSQASRVFELVCSSSPGGPKLTQSQPTISFSLAPSDSESPANQTGSDKQQQPNSELVAENSRLRAELAAAQSKPASADQTPANQLYTIHSSPPRFVSRSHHSPLHQSPPTGARTCFSARLGLRTALRRGRAQSRRPRTVGRLCRTSSAQVLGVVLSLSLVCWGPSNTLFELRRTVSTDCTRPSAPFRPPR